MSWAPLLYGLTANALGKSSHTTKLTFRLADARRITDRVLGHSNGTVHTSEYSPCVWPRPRRALPSPSSAGTLLGVRTADGIAQQRTYQSLASTGTLHPRIFANVEHGNERRRQLAQEHRSRSTRSVTPVCLSWALTINPTALDRVVLIARTTTDSVPPHTSRPRRQVVRLRRSSPSIRPLVLSRYSDA